jgi:hypothetical protein
LGEDLGHLVLWPRLAIDTDDRQAPLRHVQLDQVILLD